MKNIFKKATAIILAMATMIGAFAIPAHAGIQISGTSAKEVTMTVTTKAKWTEFLKSEPATITFKQTKGTRTFTDIYGNTKTDMANAYCLYDIKYTCYDEKGHYVNSGTMQTSGDNVTIHLKAKVGKVYTYKITIVPHYAYVYNKNTGKYYLGYKWSTPSKWTVTDTHDIVNMHATSATVLK